MAARRVSKKTKSSCDSTGNHSDMSAAVELPVAPDSPADVSNQDSPVIAVCTDQNLIKAIFQRLEISDLCAAASVCRLWNEVGNSEDFWSVVTFKNKTVHPNQVAAVLCRHQCVQNLDLSGLKSGLDDKALFERIAPCLQQLRELHFSHTAGSGHRVSDKVISIIAESLPSLRLLDLQGVSMQATAGPYHCTLDHTGLETLRLTGCESYGMTLRCRSLRRLSLADSPLMRLPDLTGCPALVELDVRGCKKMQDMTVRNALPGLVNLRTLHLGKGVPLTDETLREMATVLTLLTQLVLAETPGMTLTSVRGFPSLRVLDLSRVESLTAANLQAAVESFTALEVLLLDNCHTLATLKINMPHLREISLRGCGSLIDLELNCWRLAVLALGPVLQRLAVSSGSLKKMEWIQCRKLSQLELNCPYLTDVVIRDCDNIKPAAIEALGDKGPIPVAAVGLLARAAGNSSSLGFRWQHSAFSSREGLALDRLEIGATDADVEQDRAAQQFAAAMWPDADAAAASMEFVPAARFSGARPGYAFQTGSYGLGYYRDTSVHPDGDGDFSPKFEAAGLSADADELGDADTDGSDDDGNDGNVIGPSVTAAAGSAGRSSGRFGGWAWSARTASAAHRLEAATAWTRAGGSRARAAATSSPAQPHASRSNMRSMAAAASALAAAGTDTCRPHVRDWYARLGSNRPGSSAAAAAAAGPGTGHASSSHPRRSGTTDSLDNWLSGPDTDMDVDEFLDVLLESPRQQVEAGQQQGPAAEASVRETAACSRRFDALLAAGDDSEPDSALIDERGQVPESSWRMQQRRSIRREPQTAPDQQQSQPSSSSAAGTSSRDWSGGPLSLLPSLRMPGWRGYADAPAAAEATGSSGRALGPRSCLGPDGLFGLPLGPGELRPSRAVGSQRGQASVSQAGSSSASASAASAAAVGSIPLVVSLVGDAAGAGAAASHGSGGPTPPPMPPPSLQPIGGRGGVPQLRMLRVEGCDSLKRLNLRHSGLRALSVCGCRSLSTLVVEAPQLVRLELDEVGDLQGISLQKVGLPSLALGGCSGLAGLELASTALQQLDLRGCGQLEQLLLDCPALAGMDATFCSMFGDAGLASAIAKAPPLRQLVLSVCCQIGSTGLQSLSCLSTLQELDLSYTEVSSLDPVFCSCPQLKTLSLSSCKNLQRDALAPLLIASKPTLPQLTSLDASYCEIDENILSQLLSSCSRLEHLALNGCSSVTDQLWQQLEQAQIHRLQHAPAGRLETGATGTAVEAPGGAVLAAAAAAAGDYELSSTCSSKLASLSLVRCSNLKSLCLGLLPASGQVEVLQPKHYLLSGDREALHARSATYSWMEMSSAVSNLTSLRLGLSGVQVVALALPKLAHLDLGSCGYIRVLELRCPLLLTLQLQACRSLPMHLMAQAAVCCPQLEKLDVQHMCPARGFKRSDCGTAQLTGDGSRQLTNGSILSAAVNATQGVGGVEGGATQLQQLLDDLGRGHPSLQQLLRCPVKCGVCARAAGTALM